jgi:hypothetical protein
MLYLNNMKNNRITLWTTAFLCGNHRNNLHNLHEVAKTNSLPARGNIRPPHTPKPSNSRLPNILWHPTTHKFPVLSSIETFSTSITSQNFRPTQPPKLSDLHNFPNYTTSITSVTFRPSEPPIHSMFLILPSCLSDEFIVAVFVSQKDVQVNVSHMIKNEVVYVYVHMHFNNIKNRTTRTTE